MTGAKPSHTFAAVGSFTVTLTVTDSSGKTATATQTVTVNAGLGATITAPTTFVAGTAASFTGAGTGGTGTYSSYSWNFGDGTAAVTGAKPSHTFTAAGSFTVTLTVTDSAGKAATATKAVTVNAGLGATITAPASIIAGTAATFSGAGTGGTGTYSSYSWNFGDGTAAVTGAKPSHTFAAAGPYTVTLTVKDSAGKTATATQTVTVNAGLGATITAPSSIIAGTAASFTGAGTGGTGTYNSYSWNFGDGTAAVTGAKPSHTFAAAGPYIVTLTVKDSANKTATATQEVTVNGALTARISKNTPVNPDTGVTVSLSASASGGTGTRTYAWNFGDGATATGASVSHAYSTKGTYIVTLTVTDAGGQSVQKTATVAVYDPLQASIATPSPATPRVNQSTAFSGTGSGGKASYTAYNWDFGDGSTGSGASVTHTYTKMGPFTATLTVTDSRGKTASATKTVTTTPIGYASGTVQYRGVNLSGAEWGSGSYGVLDSSYYPNATETKYFAGKNMNLIRFPFRWERLQRSLYGAFDATELAKIQTSVDYALQAGQYVVLDQHNYARYAIGTTEYTVGSSQVPISAFADFWGKLAAIYKNEPRVMFGLTNEPHDMKTSTLVSAYNAAIVAIRNAGATSNTILVSGNAYSTAAAWNAPIFVDWELSSNATHMLQVVDPANKIVFEAHQYLDSNASGGGTECVSATIGAERLTTFTNWLKDNGKRGYLGEFGAPNTTTCQSAVTGMLQHMKNNASVYFGWSWWAAGSKWDWDPKNPYILNLEPYSDGSDRPQMGWLLPYLQ